MATLVEPQPSPKSETHNDIESYEKHIEACESVLYAKICSDYLVGQAENIEQLALIISGLKIGTNVVPGAQYSDELAYASRALEQAQWELEDAFEQFEADSTGFAHFLRKGDDWEGSRIVTFVDHASEILVAVAAARKAVGKACKMVSSLEDESFSLSELVDSLTVSGSSARDQLGRVKTWC